MKLTRRQLVRSALIGLPALTLGIPRRALSSTSFFAQTASAPILPAGPSLTFIDGYPGLAGSCTSSPSPHPGVYLGVPNPNRPPLMARALAIRSAVGGDPPVVLVSVDVSGISRALRAQIATAVAHLVPSARLALAASHTHSGPFASGSIARIKYPALATDSVASAAIIAAEQHLAQTLITLIQGVLAAPTVNVNLRFNNSGTFDAVNRIHGCAYVNATPDRGAPVLVATRVADAVPVAVVFGCSAHPRTSLCPMGGQSACGCTWEEEMHSDFPGVAAAQIEAAFPGASALFVQGCAGDQDANPTANSSLPEIEAVGQALAQTVIASVSAATSDPSALLEGPIRALSRTVLLPYDLNQSFFNGLTTLNVDAPTLRAIYQQRSIAGPEPFSRAHASYMASLPFVPRNEPLPFLAWAFGGPRPFLWFGFASEIVGSYGFLLRAHFEAAGVRTWVAGYVNEVQAYIPSEPILAAPGNCVPGASESTVVYTAGWDPRTPVPYTAPGPPPFGVPQVFNVATAVAAGAAGFYGQPCRFRAGVENRILSNARAVGELAVRAAMGCTD